MIENFEQKRREMLRWRVLQVLNTGRPYPVSEELLMGTIAGDDMPLTPRELRVELDYLRDRALIEIRNEGTPHWSVVLTRYGVDLVEYTIECDPGIARPKKYW